ncbi:hypothetical protein BGW37DRAFT_497371 [Umbelopsis sp. PMI_123]|nr:hypothetical protein BGW37DRAFT_497371 [Umbelopsis sp. PMI_123]
MKSYLFVAALAFCFTVVNAQTSTAAPVAMPSPPSTNWTILQLDAGERTSLCARQTSYCSTLCGSPTAASTNFCNATTMAWNCICSNGNNSSNGTYLDPVPFAECTGKEVACQGACPADSTRATCVQTCTNYYACGTSNAPPSYLQTANANEQPSYNGPPTSASPSSASSSVTNSSPTPSKQSSAFKFDVGLKLTGLAAITALLAHIYF